MLAELKSMKRQIKISIQISMYQNKTFLAIIPARGGSKRLPRKNVEDLCGKPLIAWSIEAGLKSKYIDKFNNFIRNYFEILSHYFPFVKCSFS